MVEYSGRGGGYGDRGNDRRNNYNNNNNSWGNSGDSNSNWNMNTIFSMKDISEKTQAHLQRVYTTLLGGVGACASGMYINENFIIQGFFMTILYFIAMGYCMYQVHNRQNPEANRIAYMLAAACAMGFSAGPAMHHIAQVQPQILTQGVVYSGTAFGSFSAVALFSRRRSYLFLGGILMTMMSVMSLYHLVGFITGGNMFGLGYLMVTLFMTCMWIIFDTQVVIEQAEHGNKDVPGHALMLFVDLFKLFIQIIRVLQEQENDKRKNKRR